MDVQVFLGSWEIECCQPPPGVGDDVAWRLHWVDEPDGAGAIGMTWHTTPLAPADAAGATGLLLRHGDVAAWWPTPVPAEVPTAGRLQFERHSGVPESVPPMRGQVVGVHVVQQSHVETDRVLQPVPGAYTLRAVRRSPRWFDRGPERPSTGERRAPTSVRIENGVLVDLRLYA